MNTILRAACLAAAAALLAIAPARAQTFEVTPVIDVTKCERLFGLFNRCATITTTRMSADFAAAKLNGARLFANTWANSSNCVWVDPAEQICKRAVSVATDPQWHRIVWGRMDGFIRAYGTHGSGTGQFSAPKGVSITRKEGEWHVAFVADRGNNRVAVVAMGESCRCERWLGTLDGTESGTPLAAPADVAWDHYGSWTFSGDRVWIADSYNNRIVSYSVTVDPVAGTMTKQYLGAYGAATGQTFSRPEGITVHSVQGGTAGTFTTLWVSDTGNERVLRFSVGNSQTGQPLYAGGSYAAAGSEFLGITTEGGEDVIVADRAGNRLVKLQGTDMTLLASYGAGTFASPTSVHGTRSYHTINGLFQEEGLPYAQTTEQWSATTGAQAHRLGVDVLNAGATPGNCSATLSFLLTGRGKYTVSVTNSAGNVVRSWPAVVTQSGWKSQYWDGKNSSGGSLPSGTYTFNIHHESGYTYDDGQPRLAQAGIGLSCFSVAANVPGGVYSKGTYALGGSASDPADSWYWEANYNGYGMSYWGGGQNSSFTAYSGEQASIEWRVHARRTSNGATAYGTGYTWVDVYCNPWEEICPMSGPAGPEIEGASTSVQDGRRAPAGPPNPADTLLRVPGQGRRNGHYGSGAWVGGTGPQGPQVVQLFSLFGDHERAGDAWPNPLGGGEGTLESRGGRPAVQVSFSRQPPAEAEERYRVRFDTRRSGFRDGWLGIAIDPDLGQHARDDLLGVDEGTGLVWVLDPDSGAVGYLVTGRPAGSRLTVRQFGRGEGLRTDPAADSAAYAEISAATNVLSGRRGDVRFLIAIGSTSLSSDVEMGLVVLRAPSLEALRTLAGRAASREPAMAPAARAGIARFRLTQAPPLAGTGPSLERISPNLIPGLESGDEPRRPAPPELRDQVRREGITALAFAVPDGEPARVEVRIHDAAGRLVRRLVDETFDPGAYRVQWDQLDEGGARVGPGVYVAVMQAPGFRSTTRLVVVR